MIGSLLLGFYFQNVVVDTTDLIAITCARILLLGKIVWRDYVSVQETIVTQKPDVELVRI